jgi:AAA family ATP:ADP antiporter
MGVVILSCIGLLVVYTFLNKEPVEGAVPKKKKEKLGLGASFSYITSSKHLGLIAALVLCYGVSINLIEALWKNEVGIAYQDPREFSAFMGSLSMWMGTLSIFFLFVGGALVRKFGWLKSAIFSPLMILVTAIPFLFLITFEHSLSFYTMAFLSAAPSTVAVMFGFAQNVLSKSTKYSFFDPTKEMAYIPLDDELKSKGKAAVDVVGGRLGKSGGAAIQQLLFWATGSNLRELAPILGVVAIAAITCWLYACRGLDKSLKKMEGEREEPRGVLAAA